MPEEGALDDMIHDAFQNDAARINNSGLEGKAAALGYDLNDIRGRREEDLDEEVVNLFSQVASESNNAGSQAQIRTLLESGFTEADITDFLTSDMEDSLEP